MKRIYKLIITNEKVYHEIDFNRADAQHSVKHISLLANNGNTYTFSVDFKDSNCRLFSDSGLRFAGDSGSVEDSVIVRCGEKARILNESADLVLFQAEVLLSSILNDNGEPLGFDFGFELHEDRVITISRDRQATVVLDDPSIGKDSLSLIYKDGNIYIKDFKARYGLFVNGIRTDQMTILNNYSFITFDGIQFYFKDGYLFTDCAYPVHLSVNWESISNKSRSTMVYPKYNRSTRIQVVIPDDPIDVLDPPPVPQKPKRNLLLTLMPSLAMLILVVVVRGFMSTTGGSFVLFSACMMGVGVLTSIFTFIDERRNYKKSLIERVDEYNQYIMNKHDEIMSSRLEEKSLLEEIYHDLPRDISAIQDFNSELFDRGYRDKDFLQVYIGKGLIPAVKEISYKKREHIEVGDDLSELPEQLKNDYKYVPHAPVISDFGKSNAVGFIGNDASLYNQMKNVTLDICIRHYYRDVKLFYIVNTDFADKIMWLRWLPHVKNESLGVRNIVCSDESKTELMEFLYALMAGRIENNSSKPHIIVFVLNDIGIKNHPVSQFFERSKDLGVTFVFFEHEKELLPEYCDEIIELDSSENEGTLQYRNDSSISHYFTYVPVDDMVAEQVALRLAPVYCEEISLEHHLRKRLSFYELLNIKSAEDIDLQKNWASSDVTKSLAAPIGVNAKNETVYLDIHEKAHGPHGLVAGTTGSGKSEILQTYVLSMAMHYSPDEVGFVIIDFKGGGMAKQFEDLGLPHLIGTITNIDGDAIERSLLSIKAEVHKRQVLFAEENVNQIDNYIQKYKAGIAKIALPHLIIIVDEFAELKAKQPEFMKELDSASRIGRSLGIHLILATQKPAGQIDDQMWSNSRFKLCLKVQEKSDSKEVLKSPVAAEIREPGRAYFQVGNNEIFELLQSGYSGESLSRNTDNSGNIRISEVSLWGKHNTVYQKTEEKQNLPIEEALKNTQLYAVVGHIVDYCNKNGIEPLTSICLPELPEKIPYPDSKRTDEENSIVVNIGKYDDPENQYQGDLELDITSGNTLVLGSAQYGKTNFLQTVIRGLAENYTPSDVNMYIIDFNAMALRNFEDLPHVGGVVCSNDEEKLFNLFNLLNVEMAKRKSIFLESGITSFSAYRKAGFREIPQIVLFIDNFTALKELYFTEKDLLLNICREGIASGISVIMTNGQTNGYRYLSNISNKFAFYCNDASEYSSLFDYCRTRPQPYPGNLLFLREKKKYSGQIYLAFPGETDFDQVRQMQSFVEAVRAQYPNCKAKEIPMVPRVLLDEDLSDAYRSTNSNSVIFGLDYKTVEPVIKDITKIGYMVLSGAEKSGKTNFMRYVASKACQMDRPVKIYIVDEMRRKLSSLKDNENVCFYSTDPESILEVIKEAEAHLKEKYRAFSNNEIYDEDLILILVSNPDVYTDVNFDKDTMESIKQLFGKYKNFGICALFNNFENNKINYNAPEFVRMLGDKHHLLFFDDIAELNIISTVPTKFLNAHEGAIELGDAYYICGSKYSKIKTVKL